MYTWKYDERWNKKTAKSIYSGPFIGTPSIPIVPGPIFQLKLQDLIISTWSLVFNPLLLAFNPRWTRFFFFSAIFCEYKNQAPRQTTHRISGRFGVVFCPGDSTRGSWGGGGRGKGTGWNHRRRTPIGEVARRSRSPRGSWGLDNPLSSPDVSWKNSEI